MQGGSATLTRSKLTGNEAEGGDGGDSADVSLIVAASQKGKYKIKHLRGGEGGAGNGANLWAVPGAVSVDGASVVAGGRARNCSRGDGDQVRTQVQKGPGLSSQIDALLASLPPQP